MAPTYNQHDCKRARVKVLWILDNNILESSLLSLVVVVKCDQIDRWLDFYCPQRGYFISTECFMFPLQS